MRLLLQDGSFTEDGNAIGSAALLHFSNILSSFPDHSQLNVDGLTEPTISSADNSFLTAPPSEEEILKVVLSIKADSAPGPDGFTSFFYQKCWSIIKADLCSAISFFFHGGQLPKLVSATHLVLIPKVKNASKMEQLRPISLCNVLHKIVSKILNNRLSALLSSIISKEQSGFIPGRGIHDNIGLAQDLSQHINQKCRGGNIILKIDMSKAYDRISWAFILSVLRGFGFSENFCDLIYRSISNCWYSILWEGKTYGFFKANRGVRQGDPISSSLFILAMEVLSRILNSAYRDKKIGYYFTKAKALNITHLLYADDILIFANGAKSSVNNLAASLDVFCKLSGQVINHAKSSILFSSSIPVSRRNRVLNASSFTQGYFPIKYLGANLYVGRANRVHFQFLEDNIKARISSWMKGFLSMAGRAALIQSVLSSISLHILAVLPVPIQTLNRIQRHICNFLWDNGSSSRFHWISWNKICLPKLEGGLGLRSILDIRKAMLAKLAWKFLKNESLWIKFIRSTRTSRGYCSFIWKKVEPFVNRLRRESGWIIGKGDLNIAIFSEWLDQSTHPDIAACSLRQVFEDQNLLNSVSPLQRLVLQKAFSDNHSLDNDRLVWNQAPSGEFSANAFYHCTRRTGIPKKFLQNFWSDLIPPKISILLWRLYHKAIPSDDLVITKGLQLASVCQCCSPPCCESSDHIFFTGFQALQNWRILAKVFNKPLPSSSDGLWHQWMQPKHVSYCSILAGLAACCLIWELWLFRNKKKMEGESRNVNFRTASWLSRLAPLIKTPVGDPMLNFIISRQLQIPTLLSKAAPPPLLWFPHHSGLTMSCATIQKDGSFCFGYILRDSLGHFAFAGLTRSQSDAIIPLILSIVESLPLHYRTIQLIQSSHPLMENLSKLIIAWEDIRLWRKLAALLPSCSFVYCSPAANQCASCIAFTASSDCFPSAGYLPLPAFKSFWDDLSRIQPVPPSV